MGKGEFRRKSYIDEKDEHEKELYLKELGNSVHNYIKTGVKNRQLDELIELEETFNQKYQERFDTRKLAEQISDFSRNSVCEIVNEYLESNSATTSIIKEQDFSLSSIRASKTYEVLLENVYNRLDAIVRDTAYLSHMNMLYEIYEKEERLRREEEEYDRISEKYQKMADVLKKLSRQKRMELEQLQEQTDLSRAELENLLGQNTKYFNVRKKSESIQVSLSPSGRKYYDHVMDAQETFSRETLHQIIYKNCDNLMESLENSYENGIEYKLRLEKVPPDRERAIQLKYHTIAQKIISDHEETYPLKNFGIKKESVYNEYEENRFKIPKLWFNEII